MLESLQILFCQVNRPTILTVQKKVFESTCYYAVKTISLTSKISLFIASNNSVGLFTAYLSLNLTQLLTYCLSINTLCRVSIFKILKYVLPSQNVEKERNDVSTQQPMKSNVCFLPLYHIRYNVDYCFSLVKQVYSVWLTAK